MMTFWSIGSGFRLLQHDMKNARRSHNDRLHSTKKDRISEKVIYRPNPYKSNRFCLILCIPPPKIFNGVQSRVTEAEPPHSFARGKRLHFQMWGEGRVLQVVVC